MKWRSALRPVAAVSLKSPVKESPSAFQSATAWTARGGAAVPLQRRRGGKRRELCSLADQKRGSVWLTAVTRRRTSSALIAARRSHTSSKAGPAWSQCPSAHLRTPPSPPRFICIEHPSAGGAEDVPRHLEEPELGCMQKGSDRLLWVEACSVAN